MKKKFLLTLMVITISIIAFGTISASAETSGTCGDNLTWTLDDEGTLTISGSGDMQNWQSDYKVPWANIRDSIIKVEIEDGATSIGKYAFYRCSGLLSITLPNSITTVEDFAFDDCYNLASVNIEDIGAWCQIDFYYYNRSNPLSYAKNLYINGELATNIKIPDGVTNIKYATFYNCTNITSVIIPDSVTSIEGAAFFNCTKLTNVVIPKSVVNIKDSAFCGCQSLTDIIIPDSVLNIGDRAFSGCNSLNTITIPDSVLNIGDSAFSGCNSLNTITIPDSVLSIGDSAFSGCDNLVRVTIGKGIELIPEYAFCDCIKLEYVFLPVDLKSIRNDAFNACPNIKTVFYIGNETQWNGILFYSRNENLTDAKIVYNATKKTYKFETNCDAKLDDVTDYAIFTMPSVENDGMTLNGWYDNKSLSGEPVTFPYYGDATTLYASWTDRTGKSFDDAFIAKANQEYSVTTTENGQYVYFEFVPNLSKQYYFYTTGSKDTYGYLYNKNKSQLTYNDDAGEGNNFYISYSLTAGETYYIAAKLYSGTGTFTFVVEEPVDYRINEITIKDMSGNTLQEIPTGTFLATVSFTNVSSSADTVIILAQYTDAGAFKGLMYIQTEDVPIGSTIKLSIPVDNSNGDVAKLKAFCWESFGSLTPMGNSASFPAEQ